MDSCPATATNATDSSVVSSFVVSSLNPQLEMSPSTSSSTDGPINLMPSEIMQLILTKLGLDSDANKLIRLRLVSRWWNSLVVDYCQQKKCLFVNCFRGYKHELAFSNPLIVYSKSIDFLGEILKLFPNTEELALDCADVSQVLTIAAHINSLSSLKQLHLHYYLLRALPYLSQTLSRLELLALEAYSHILTDDEVIQFVGHLGPNCGRVFLGKGEPFNFKLVLQWHTVNPHWLVNLTHLQMVIHEEEYFGQIVHFLAGHAPALNSLNFSASSYRHFEMTLPVLADLGALTHLSELKLWRLELDIARLDEEATQRRLTSLSTVLAVDFLLYDGPKLVNTNSFTRVLSAMFPNLSDLTLKIGPNLSVDADVFIRGIETLYLDRFPKLVRHKIEYE